MLRLEQPVSGVCLSRRDISGEVEEAAVGVFNSRGASQALFRLGCLHQPLKDRYITSRLGRRLFVDFRPHGINILRLAVIRDQTRDDFIVLASMHTFQAKVLRTTR